MSLNGLRTELWHLRRGGVQQWRRYRARRRIPALGQGGAVATRPGQARGQLTEAPDIPEWTLPERPPRRGLKVGIIADEFTELALRYEWDQVPLGRETWREQIADKPVELLFVESAWNGNGGSWKYALTGSKAPWPELRELVAHCREHGIPTVFWNKEDPVHFEDFLSTAALFDYVLTTEGEKVPEYVARLGHDRVFVMPFAAASWIHNPVRLRAGANRDIAFGGMYYQHRFPARRAQMDLLLGAAMDVSHRMERGLEIFSRFLDTDERYQFPKRFADRVVGELSYRQMLTAYRDFKVFLNVSSVPESTTMCPRRIFEISACATPVVSTPTPAIDAFFGRDEMVTVLEPQEAQWALRALVRNDQWRQRMAHKAARRVLSEHTYRHRVDEVLDLVDLGKHRTSDPTVSVVVSTNRPHQVDHVLQQVAAQQDVTPQLVLVSHGFTLPHWVKGRARELGLTDVVTHEVDAALTLGECLNAGIARASGDVVAKFDDDDLYGPYYLADQLRALDYSGADVVGKQAHHLLLNGPGVLMVRFPEREHRFTDMVMGPTLMMRRELAVRMPFAARTRGEDTHFLRRVLLAGGRVYSSDRYNFIQVRNDEGHTWEATDVELLANGDVVAYGAGARHVFV
ncbi:glycosyltransferase family protein [Ornithinimicrobium sufpigmenti]|uniref:glycosyltransferase family protein n=1 Tax=Ornithinimicrobium sufpigmenti TaxID=2508882 RepID=UPI0010355542|nr:MULTISPECIES: glycosyltransferase [unclassified Ornithinimicrobium]